MRSLIDFPLIPLYASPCISFQYIFNALITPWMLQCSAGILTTFQFSRCLDFVHLFFGPCESSSFIHVLTIEAVQVVKRVSSSLRYSPISACLKQTIPVGSSLLASWVLRAVTPKPYMDKISTHVRSFKERRREEELPEGYHSCSGQQHQSARGIPHSIVQRVP